MKVNKYTCKQIAEDILKKNEMSAKVHYRLMRGEYQEAMDLIVDFANEDNCNSLEKL